METSSNYLDLEYARRKSEYEAEKSRIKSEYEAEKSRIESEYSRKSLEISNKRNAETQEISERYCKGCDRVKCEKDEAIKQRTEKSWSESDEAACRAGKFENRSGRYFCVLAIISFIIGMIATFNIILSLLCGAIAGFILYFVIKGILSLIYRCKFNAHIRAYIQIQKEEETLAQKKCSELEKIRDREENNSSNSYTTEKNNLTAKRQYDLDKCEERFVLDMKKCSDSYDSGVKRCKDLYDSEVKKYKEDYTNQFHNEYDQNKGIVYWGVYNGLLDFIQSRPRGIAYQNTKIRIAIEVNNTKVFIIATDVLHESNTIYKDSINLFAANYKENLENCHEITGFARALSVELRVKLLEALKQNPVDSKYDIDFVSANDGNIVMEYLGNWC